MRDLMLRAPGTRFGIHAAITVAIWAALTWFNGSVEPQLSYYLALAAMYATAMFGMTILVGLSGQVSLGNGALMAVGGYVFALTSMHWSTVPIIGVPWNAVWSVVFAGLGGVLVGAVIGALGARLRGPYLAGLTLGLAVGVPTIVNRFPALLGGEDGLKLIVPYPEGGYPEPESEEAAAAVPVDESFLDEFVMEEELPAGESTGEPNPAQAEDDLLTLDDVESGVDPGVAEDDLLTLDDVESGVDASSPSDVPLEDVPLEDVPLEEAAAAVDTAGASDFILQQWQASVAIAVACIVGFLALNLVRGRQGRVWEAVRDDPVAAAVVGIPPAGAKVSAFVVSSLFAALAGAVLAQILTFVGSGAFGLGLSLSLLVGVVLGGRMSLAGAAIGAVLLVWLPELVDSLSAERGWPDQVTNNAPNLLYGLLVVAVVLIAPGGVMGALSAGWARVRRRRGNRVHEPAA